MQLGLKTCATCVEKIRNLAARKDNINNVEETFTYDNYVQDPTSQQSFNRYAYCVYNPLKYVDPSGERRCSNGEEMWQGIYESLLYMQNQMEIVAESKFELMDMWMMSIESMGDEPPGGGGNDGSGGSGGNAAGGGNGAGSNGGGGNPNGGNDGKTTQTGNGQNGTQSNSNVDDYNKDLAVTGVSGTASLIGGVAGEELRLAENITDIEAWGLKGMKNIGIGINVIAFGINAVDDYSDYNNGDISLGQFWAKTTISAVGVAVGFIPCVGPVLSITITVVDCAGGFDWLYNKF